MKVRSSTAGLNFLEVHSTSSPQGSHQELPLPPAGNSAQTLMEIAGCVHVETAEQLFTSVEGGALGLLSLLEFHDLNNNFCMTPREAPNISCTNTLYRPLISRASPLQPLGFPIARAGNYINIYVCTKSNASLYSGREIRAKANTWFS